MNAAGANETLRDTLLATGRRARAAARALALASTNKKNAALAANPSSNGVSQFSLRFSENFGTAFKKRNIATSAVIKAMPRTRRKLTTKIT